MTRRSRPILAAFAAVVVLTARPLPSLADQMPYYELTNTMGAGSPPVKSVLLSVTPPGSVLNKDNVPSIQNPKSVGFDVNSLVGGGFQTVIPDGQPHSGPFQALGLGFGPNGFGPGDVLDFQLKTTGTSASPPHLDLIDPSKIFTDPSVLFSSTTTPPSVLPNAQVAFLPNAFGLQLTYVDPSATASPVANANLTSNTPEPLSLVIWSTLAGIGLVRARAVRRPKPVPA